MSKQHCRTLQVEPFFRQCRMLLRHCCRFWQQCRTKFRPLDKVETNGTCLGLICFDFVERTKFYNRIVRHCCWCGRGLTLSHSWWTRRCQNQIWDGETCGTMTFVLETVCGSHVSWPTASTAYSGSSWHESCRLRHRHFRRECVTSSSRDPPTTNDVRCRVGPKAFDDCVCIWLYRYRPACIVTK